MASMTGFSEDFGDAELAGFRPRYFCTQSYCSQPFSGKSSLTAFHFGCPFSTSHPMLEAMIWAKRPTLSQSRRRKSNETRTALTATVDSGFDCHRYVFAGISAVG